MWEKIESLKQQVNSKYNIDIRKECEVEGERKHDAMNDVAYQIRVATRGWNMLM